MSVPRGAAGRTHCGRWRPVPYHRFDTGRLVCTLAPGHRALHHSAWSGWWWGDDPERQPIRTWVCNGDAGRCGRKHRGSEDHARVKGWRIGRRPNGDLDPLCPECGAPDPVARGYARDLERSLARRSA